MTPNSLDLLESQLAAGFLDMFEIMKLTCLLNRPRCMGVHNLIRLLMVGKEIPRELRKNSNISIIAS
jgi:hypothetical protein